MKYKEYLVSAKRHKHACQVLEDKLNTLKDEGLESDEFNFLVLSMYYLSGYIIECSLKFKIFELKGYDPNIDVNEDNCKLFDINYKKNIKKHNFSSLQNYLDSLISGFPHLSSDSNINRLLGEWSPEIRYSHVDLDYDQIKKFYNHSKQYLRKM